MMKLQMDIAAETPFEMYMALAEVTRQLRQGVREDAQMICEGKAEYDFWLQELPHAVEVVAEEAA
jgi:hypothetical protein